MASKQSRLLPGRLCSVGSPAAASVLRRLFETVEQLKQAIMDEWCALSQKFIDRNEWRRRLKCVIQQNGRHIEHLLNKLFSCRLYTRFLLQFIDLLCKLHIYTRAVLCGATYRSTAKSSRSHIRLFIINCFLCMRKISRFG